MSSKLPKKALIAITSHSAPFYPDGSVNGMFYTEVLHPYQVLSQAGFDIDLASETGTYTLDPYSVTEQFVSGDDVTLVKDPASPLNKLLANSVKKASDVKPEDYGMFFASAGFATVYDYPKATALQAVAENVWERGGVIAAVCHGGAIFPGIKDAATGKSIIADKKVTGFSTEADKLAGVLDKIHADGVMTTEESAVSAGANYVAPPSPFAEFAVTDGRIVSGANPFSAHATAVAALEAFDKI
jgi:putative intracellular protease/amidase